MYVAMGHPARHGVRESVKTLQKYNNLPVVVLADGWPVTVLGVEHIWFQCDDPGARIAKLNLPFLASHPYILYLDADTRVNGDVGVGFDLLEDGWDLVLASSTRQGGDVLGNCTQKDREKTFTELGCRDILGLQAGVMWFHNTTPIRDLFNEWAVQWNTFKEKDQSALIRALHKVPVKVWILGNDFNDSGPGHLIEHHFGSAAR